MPNIKTGFNPWNVTHPYLCPRCNQAIPQGSMNWSFSTSTLAKYGEKRWFHKECPASPISSPITPSTPNHKCPSCSVPVSNQMDHYDPNSNTWKCPSQIKKHNCPSCSQEVDSITEHFHNKTWTCITTPAEPKATPAEPAKPSAPAKPIAHSGKHFMYEELKRIVTAESSVYLDIYIPGAPGSGKSFTIKQLAQELNMEYRYIALSETSTLSNVFGYISPATGKYVSTPFRELYEHGGMLDIAELDNCDSNLFTALNNALDNGACLFPDSNTLVKRHPQFKCIGNGNTDLRGPTQQFPSRQRMDAASIERFLFLSWDYDQSLEYHLAGAENRNIVAWMHLLREKSKGMEIVVSMRALLKAIQLKRAGFTPEKCVQMAIFKNHPATETLLKACPLSLSDWR